jgi:hypothetical protein
MMDFIKSILVDNGFVSNYIDTILCSDFLNQDDLDFYEKCKSRNIWKTRVFNKLGFKSFTKQSLNYWRFRGYNSIECRDMVNSNKLKRTEPTPMQKQFWIDKGMSSKDAQSKINSFRKTMPEYWISRGFTKVEALDKITEYQKENSEKLKKKKIESPELFEDIGWNQKKYWIKKGLSEEESIKKVSELQNTFSLDKCIEKYGDAGMEIWKERQKKWVSKVFNENTNISSGTSKMSCDFIDDLLHDVNFTGTFLFGADEKYIMCNNTKKSFKYDFTYVEGKKIIEINGDFWHFNPDFYSNHSLVNKVTGKNLLEIRNYDLYKIKIAQNNGYNVLVIWENDIKKNRLETIKKCINFLEK